MNTCPFEHVKVVILGQDPYHNDGQAMGLSFSVPPGVAKPSSLQNIFKELKTDLDCPIPNHGSLEKVQPLSLSQTPFILVRSGSSLLKKIWLLTTIFCPCSGLHKGCCCSTPA